MANVVKSFFRDIVKIFSGHNLLWHMLAILGTYILVVSGFDWWILTYARDAGLRELIRSGNAGFVGYLVPVALPIIFWTLGWMRRNKKLLIVGLLIAQAELIGLLVSFFYKALTGRPGPGGFRAVTEAVADPSSIFQFGFLRGGVYWGWPSSHIMVAISAAVLLMIIYKREPVIKYLALGYAMYMAISVSLTFHWFSDGVAAVILGSVVGWVVARNYQQSVSA